MRLVKFVALAAIVAAPILASAHANHDEDVIEARRAYFKLFAANIGPLAAMAKGKAPYDSDRAMVYARNFAAIAQYDPTPHFAPGTSTEDAPGKTRALPEIWENRGSFGEQIVAFNDAVAFLQGAGRADLGAAVQKLCASCKGCHDDFRAKDF